VKRKIAVDRVIATCGFYRKTHNRPTFMHYSNSVLNLQEHRDSCVGGYEFMTP